MTIFFLIHFSCRTEVVLLIIQIDDSFKWNYTNLIKFVWFRTGNIFLENLKYLVVCDCNLLSLITFISPLFAEKILTRYCRLQQPMNFWKVECLHQWLEVRARVEAVGLLGFMKIGSDKQVLILSLLVLWAIVQSLEVVNFGKGFIQTCTPYMW